MPGFFQGPHGGKMSLLFFYRLCEDHSNSGLQAFLQGAQLRERLIVQQIARIGVSRIAAGCADNHPAQSKLPKR